MMMVMVVKKGVKRMAMAAEKQESRVKRSLMVVVVMRVMTTGDRAGDLGTQWQQHPTVLTPTSCRTACRLLLLLLLSVVAAAALTVVMVMMVIGGQCSLLLLLLLSSTVPAAGAATARVVQ